MLQSLAKKFSCLLITLIALSLPAQARWKQVKPADTLPCLPVQSFELEAFGEGTMTTNGAARTGEGRLVLVDGRRATRGSAYGALPIALTTDSVLTTHVRFRMDEQLRGAPEGLTFVLHAAGPQALGHGGPGLGYRGIRPSLAIELDTRRDRFDRDDNHVGVDLFGRLRSLRAASVDFPLADGALHGLWVELDGPGKRLRVWVGEDPDVRPLDPTIEIARDGALPHLGAATFAGFTASARRGMGGVAVESWQLSVERGCPCFTDDDCDDARFCNGEETCGADGRCEEGAPPCEGDACDEPTQSCPTDTGLIEWGRAIVGEQPQTIYLEQRYVDPVVVATVHHASGGPPVVARVGSVGPDAFTIRLQNPSNEPVAAESVSYIVVESGAWELDGQRFEARHYESTQTDGRDNWIGTPQSYLQSYTAPVVIGQVMSDNDPRWSVFWAQGAARTDPPAADALITGKTVAEDTDTDRLQETVGYIVFESGSLQLAGVACEFALGPDTVAGVDDDGAPFAYTFLQPFATAPEVTLTSIAGIDGNGGGWAEPHGPIAADAERLFLAIDEDQIADDERRHATEQVSYAVCERQGSAW